MRPSPKAPGRCSSLAHQVTVLAGPGAGAFVRSRLLVPHKRDFVKAPRWESVQVQGGNLPAPCPQPRMAPCEPSVFSGLRCLFFFFF